MISSWSAKRKLLYGGGFVVFVAIISILIFWKVIYIPPTCSDGFKNGDETGVDCGGNCKNICTDDALNPIVLWAKAFNISGSVYNLAAYIQNPNVNSKNLKVIYEFKVFDEKNILITSREGETFIPKNKKFIVFEPGLILENSKPKRVEFSFKTFSVWEKDLEVEPKIIINHSSLISTTTSPRVEGTISNQSSKSLGSIELSTIILDGKENVIAVSRTFIDNLAKNSSQNFVFTWPKPFSLGFEACINPTDTILVLDRSGSMASESKDLPEPFTTVKNTAKDFIKSLAPDDRVGLVSFGTEAVLNSSLTTNKQEVINSIDSLMMSTTSIQTNIGDGLDFALKESISNQSGSKKVIIMLTDGEPTEPKDKNDTNYPKTYAQKIAKDILDSNIVLYTIGLGKEISDDFLKSLVLDSNYYYKSPTKDNLTSIYKNISSSLCIKKPSVVNVIYRILPE